MGGISLQLMSFQHQEWGLLWAPAGKRCLVPLPQLKVAAMLSLENAVPLGWSRGMVVPSLAVQAALEYGCSPPKQVLCSRAGLRAT